eukprot:CAMPEP_0114561192 /NCGR_PEP_ID=MMETSP0114-20121206/11872_1 /TAXON_ID=31324 /ORGANISM="Goniomonas sp, Strain m" /LENGTH=201 /DNA_ID=CAMNT_0001746809 /DNA_START=107 /DNA_END=715 /DNA_ORIENTATION=-
MACKRQCCEDSESDASTVAGSPTAADVEHRRDDQRHVRARTSKKVRFSFFSAMIEFGNEDLIIKSTQLFHQCVETKPKDGPDHANEMFGTLLLQFVERRTICDHEDILSLFAAHGVTAFSELKDKCCEIANTLEKRGRVAILPSTLLLNNKLLRPLQRLKLLCDRAWEVAIQREIGAQGDLQQELASAALTSVSEAPVRAL